MARRLASYRPLLRPLAWALVAGLAVAAAWRSPLSPFSLYRGDVLAVGPEPDTAVAHYDRVARWNPWPSVRLLARQRAATVLMVVLDDPVGARVRLRQVVEDEHIDAAGRAAGWAAMGDVLRHGFDDPAMASSAYRMAFDADPTGPEAQARLVAAASARAAAGELDDAHYAWDKVARRFPALSARARLEQAALMLGRGRVTQAQELYARAAEAAIDPVEEEVAREGEKTCRERLGRIEAALAAAESSDLSARLEELRQAELEGRSTSD